MYIVASTLCSCAHANVPRSTPNQMPLVALGLEKRLKIFMRYDDIKRSINLAYLLVMMMLERSLEARNSQKTISSAAAATTSSSSSFCVFGCCVSMHVSAEKINEWIIIIIFIAVVEEKSYSWTSRNQWKQFIWLRERDKSDKVGCKNGWMENRKDGSYLYLFSSDALI